MEAARRHEIRPVPVKGAEQQGVLALHAARALVVKPRTMLASALRGLAAEFGHVASEGKHTRHPICAPTPPPVQALDGLV